MLEILFSVANHVLNAINFLRFSKIRGTINTNYFYENKGSMNFIIRGTFLNIGNKTKGITSCYLIIRDRPEIGKASFIIHAKNFKSFYLEPNKPIDKTFVFIVEDRIIPDESVFVTFLLSTIGKKPYNHFGKEVFKFRWRIGKRNPISV